MYAKTNGGVGTYSHLLESVNQEAACKFENTILEAGGSKMVANTLLGN
jgi:hypothetical protein